MEYAKDEAPENPSQPPAPTSELKAKEGEPKIHTVYAYLSAEQKRDLWHQVHEVIAIYTEPQDDMPGIECVPLHVYEREEDLPDAIRKRIRPDDGKRLPMEVLRKEEGVVYAVLPNTDVTEGSGHTFIWVLVTDPSLANKIAQGNGCSGSNAEVAIIRLDELIEKRPPNVRRDKGILSDELYVEQS